MCDKSTLPIFIIIKWEINLINEYKKLNKNRIKSNNLSLISLMVFRLFLYCCLTLATFTSPMGFFLVFRSFDTLMASTRSLRVYVDFCVKVTQMNSSFGAAFIGRIHRGDGQLFFKRFSYAESKWIYCLISGRFYFS